MGRNREHLCPLPVNQGIITQPAHHCIHQIENSTGFWHLELFFLMFIYFWESMSEGGTEKEGDRRSEAVLTAASQMWGWNSQTVRSQPEPKSDTQQTEPPKHPVPRFCIAVSLQRHNWLHNWPPGWTWSAASLSFLEVKDFGYYVAQASSL